MTTSPQRPSNIVVVVFASDNSDHENNASGLPVVPDSSAFALRRMRDDAPLMTKARLFRLVGTTAVPWRTVDTPPTTAAIRSTTPVPVTNCVWHSRRSLADPGRSDVPINRTCSPLTDGHVTASTTKKTEHVAIGGRNPTSMVGPFVVPRTQTTAGLPSQTFDVTSGAVVDCARMWLLAGLESGHRASVLAGCPASLGRVRSARSERYHPTHPGTSSGLNWSPRPIAPCIAFLAARRRLAPSGVSCHRPVGLCDSFAISCASSLSSC